MDLKDETDRQTWGPVVSSISADIISFCVEFLFAALQILLPTAQFFQPGGIVWAWVARSYGVVKRVHVEGMGGGERVLCVVGCGEE